MIHSYRNKHFVPNRSFPFMYRLSSIVSDINIYINLNTVRRESCYATSCFLCYRYLLCFSEGCLALNAGKLKRLTSSRTLFWENVGHMKFLTFWHRNYFFNFSTPCIKNVNKTGTKYVRIMKETAFWREKNGEYIPCLKYSVTKFVIFVESIH